MENKKTKSGKFMLIFVCIFIFMHISLSAIKDLTNTRDLYTVTLDSAFQIIHLEHTIQGLIPTGTSYYYVGIVEDTQDAYLIKSSKRWFKRNFTSDYTALNPTGVHITGLVKEVSPDKLSDELVTRLSQLKGVNYPLSQVYYLDLEYKSVAVFKLIFLVLLVILIIIGVYILKHINSVKPVYKKLWGIAITILLVILGLYLRPSNITLILKQ